MTQQRAAAKALLISVTADWAHPAAPWPRQTRWLQAWRWAAMAASHLSGTICSVTADHLTDHGADLAFACTASRGRGWCNPDPVTCMWMWLWMYGCRVAPHSCLCMDSCPTSSVSGGFGEGCACARRGCACLSRRRRLAHHAFAANGQACAWRTMAGVRVADGTACPPRAPVAWHLGTRGDWGCCRRP